ncbi:MAG: 8-amino-7-oxononanoate synthase [Rhodospirillaceae bacterium]|nr:8-amino-7-oxononanoate synthase [Rhodospirillaceae bacterium]MBT4749689.1 8-amino-7-oxononanoate synthase [Rhodospirillaceae bacterium]
MDQSPHPGARASLDAHAKAKLDQLQEYRLRRSLAETQRTGVLEVMRAGRKLISFSCNDYLNLSRHPDVMLAAKDAIDTHGAGSGASRLVTGNHPLFGALEARLAQIKGTEAALIFGSGYLANIGIIPALAGDGDLILADKLVHSCMHVGAALSGAKVVRFAHNDADALAAALAGERAGARNCLILTESVFSMDGDRAPLGAAADLAEAHDAWLMTDDAHGFGVVTPDPAAARAPLQMGTLSKAVGAYGGYLCASRPVIDLLVNRARSLIYSTGLSPADAGASLAALDIIAKGGELTERPLANARLFTQLMELDEAASPIVPLVLGDAERALALSEELEAAGFLVAAIRPPTVPEGTARLRFTFSAGHSEEQVRALANAVRAGLAGMT